MKKFLRRKYENVAMVAVRESREVVLFWARRCRKSTTLGRISFDEMSREPGRTVIGASASLLLGKEIVGMTLGATEQAEIVTAEAAAMRQALEVGAGEKGFDLKVADASQDKILSGLSAKDFAGLYQSSNMEMRLYFDRTKYSRLKIIAPNPNTARGWGGTVLRDEAGYTPVGLETELRIATKPIMDTDPSFKLIYASNLCPNDRHPFFEMTMPPPDMEFPPRAEGHLYRGQNNILVHRVALADAYAAGHVLFDDVGKPLTLVQFRALPGNRLGLAISYDLTHQSGGTAAIDLISLLNAQRRGAGKCVFAFVENEGELRQALAQFREVLGPGRVGLGLDPASTTGQTSNPTSITVSEQSGSEYLARLVLVFKTKKRRLVSERLQLILKIVRERERGGPVVRLAIDASNERLSAEETSDDLSGLVAVELVINSVSIHPPGYEDPINYKTFLGDMYSNAVNDGRVALPADPYIKTDHRLTMKDQGRYVCDPDPDGKHGDTFDSGKLSLHALNGSAPFAYRAVEFPSRSAGRIGRARGLLV